MESAEVKVGDVYKRKDSGKLFIVDRLISIKDRGDGNWYEGVLVFPAAGGDCYAYWLDDFNEKFDPQRQ